MLLLLWNQRILKVSVDHSYYVSFSFFYTFSLPSSSMAKPPTSLHSFSRFATVSSPFLQLALCPFPESSKKPEEQEEEVPPQEVDTSLFFFLLSFFFFFLLPPPFFLN